MPHVLIIKPSSLGDIVHGLQVVASMKAQRSDLKVSWIVREIFAPIVRACEQVDQTFVFQRHGGLVGFFSLMREVRAQKLDYVFDMQGLLRTGLMTFRANAEKKVGLTDSREGSKFFYDEQVPLPPHGSRSHSLEKLLQFCVVLGLKPELRGAVKFREVSGLNLHHLEGPHGVRPIVMFPDSRRADKRWQGFKQLTELILREDRRRRVIWAGNNYLPDKDAFLPEQFLNLTGNTSLVSLPALVQRAQWVISNESGPMHLAAALGVPLLAIIGPSDPEVLGPYPLRGSTNHVIQAPVGDMKMLSAKDVFARFQRVAGAPRVVGS